VAPRNVRYIFEQVSKNHEITKLFCSIRDVTRLLTSKQQWCQHSSFEKFLDGTQLVNQFYEISKFTLWKIVFVLRIIDSFDRKSILHFYGFNIEMSNFIEVLVANFMLSTRKVTRHTRRNSALYLCNIFSA